MNFNYSVTKGYKRYREAIRYGIVISVEKRGKRGKKMVYIKGELHSCSFFDEEKIIIRFIHILNLSKKYSVIGKMENYLWT